MNIDIMVANTKQVVILKKDSEIAHFLGFIKANININAITNIVLRFLFLIISFNFIFSTSSFKV